MSFNTSFLAPGVGRSNRNLSTTITFSTQPGVITPFWHRVTRPGDRWRVSAAQGIETLPLQSPLLSTFRSRIAFFWLSWRALNPNIHFNSGSVDPRTVAFPYYHRNPSLRAGDGPDSFGNIYRNSSGIHVGRATVPARSITFPSSLENYLYYDAGTVHWIANETDTASAFYVPQYIKTFQVSAAPLLTYLFTVYHWYTNWQMTDMSFISYVDSSTTNLTGIGDPHIETISQANFSDYLLSQGLNRTPGLVNTTLQNSTSGTHPSFDNFYLTMGFGVYGGLFLCPYASDYLSSYTSVANRNAVASAGTIDVSSGSFSIDTFIGTGRIKKYLELGFFGASGFRDWVYSQFAVTPSPDLGVPSCLGFSDLYMNFSAVVATSQEGLGDLGGRGQASGSMKRRKWNFTEFGTLIGIHTLVPIVSYDNPELLEDRVQYLSDLASPALDRVAWQPLLRRQLGTALNYDYTRIFDLTASDWTVDSQNWIHLDQVIGYQPAWSEYTADVSRTYGTVSSHGSLSHWMLHRAYYVSDDASTSAATFTAKDVVIPWLYNRPFVDTSRTSGNFIVQIKLDILCARAIGKNPIPSVA